MSGKVQNLLCCMASGEDKFLQQICMRVSNYCKNYCCPCESFGKFLSICVPKYEEVPCSYCTMIQGILQHTARRQLRPNPKSLVWMRRVGNFGLSRVIFQLSLHQYQRNRYLCSSYQFSVIFTLLRIDPS